MNNEESSHFHTAAELRAFIQGDLGNDNDFLHKHLGFAPNKDKLEFLNTITSLYNPDNPEMPHEFKNTDLGKMIIKNMATLTGSKAVKQGNISQMKFLTGLQNYEKDISGLHTLIELEEKLNQDAYIAYLFGHMGNGKTDFAFLLGELGIKRNNLEIATNVKSATETDKNIEYIYTYGQLLEWLTGGHKVESLQEVEKLRNEGKEIDASNKLFIFDEGSNFASGYSQDAYETQKKLGNTVKLIRKVGGRLIIIGHTGKDVHPDIRRLTDDCITKVSTKTAEFYKSVNESGNGVDLKYVLSNIPPTNLTYDTLEISFWDWTLETPSELKQKGVDISERRKQSKEERNAEIVESYITNQHPKINPNENGKITQDMLGDFYGITPVRIGQIIKKFKEQAEEFQEMEAK